MPRWNGGVIGAANNPTTSSAKGIWSLSEATKAIRAGLWPPSNAGADPYFENVTMLLSADGTNGAQNNTFLDSSTNAFTITRNGNTTQGTFTPFSKPDGRWSNYFDGSGDYLTAPSNAAFAVGSTFTIEFWLYPISFGANAVFVYLDDSSGGLQFGLNSGNLSLAAAGVAWRLSGSAGPTLNTWNHCVLVRSGTGTNQTSIFLNGTRIANGTVTDAWTTTVGALIQGSTSTYQTSGYMSNVRIVKGTAVYDPTQSTLTVPTAPLTAISGTSLLTCQSNRFIDNSTNAFAITRNGDVSVQTFSPFPTLTAYAAGTNGGSGYFDGSGDYLSVASQTALGMGSGDFTYEAWVYVNEAVPTNAIRGLFDSRISSATGCGIYTSVDSGNTSKLAYATNSAIAAASTNTIRSFAWTHVAVTRSGTTVRGFINGALEFTYTDSRTFASSASTYIGADTGLNYFNGYVSGARILKGTAQYTAAFTPPTAPLTAITNTSLLLSGTNGGIIDNAMSNDLETVGNAQISTTQSKFGGSSMYFDGNDKCVMPYTQNFNLGTTYTIEAWIYPTTVSGYQRIFDIVNSATSSPAFLDVALNGTALVSELRTANGGGVTTISGGTVSANTWSHVALSVSAGSAKLFLNGTQVGSTTTLSALPDQNFVGIGGIGNSLTIDYLTGYIDDLRITKGYARYTANFTAPTAPFPLFGD